MKIYKLADNINVDITKIDVVCYDPEKGYAIFSTTRRGEFLWASSEYKLTTTETDGEIRYVVSPRDSADTTIDVAF